MLSIFILYSADRLPQLRLTVECLRDMPGFFQCQKIICVDGKTNATIPDFDTVEVPRREHGFYCWADCWAAAITAAKFDIILYIDSDRIIPVEFLMKCREIASENTFVFPKRLYQLKFDVPIALLRSLRDNPKDSNDVYADHRVFNDPIAAIRKKNPMSGCVSFTKETFWRSGGLDPSFCGWGYPDTDYFMTTFKQGCKFIAVDCDELHLHHNYQPGVLQYRLMNLYNGVLFCKKWDLEIPNQIKNLSTNLGIPIRKIQKYDTLQKFMDDQSATTTKKLII